MRLTLTTAFVLTAVLLPATAAALCVPQCEVPGGNNVVGFYAPPLLAITSGETVTWTSLDVPHTATDRASFCFSVPYDADQPGAAQFFVQSGTLFAKVGSGLPKACSAATALPDGSKLLAYECIVHPTMKAQLLVK